METTTILTLEGALIFIVITMLAIIGWVGKRYITKDDVWKRETDARLQKMADQRDLNEAFDVLRDHGERIVKLETWQEAHEKYFDHKS